MSFVQAMSAMPATKTGVNGETVYTEDGVGDARVTLFTMLNRGLDLGYIDSHIKQMYQRPECQRDAWVMAFQTRDVRGGKGERDLFHMMMASLYKVDQEMTKTMLSLIPEYGSWRDLFELWQMVPELENRILSLICKKYKEDLSAYRNNQNNKLSLLVKWLPREKSKTYPKMAQKIANDLFPEEPTERHRIIIYRKMCSAINKELKTVETNMCGKTWAKIAPEKVPGRNMKLHDKAFLNEMCTSRHRRNPRRSRHSRRSCNSNDSDSSEDEDSNLRYPKDQDRMTCRANFQEFLEEVKIGKKTVKGANVVMPHELVVKAVGRGGVSADQETILQGQWDSIRQETLKAGGLGKAVAMCDFSGSMSGLPLEISKALGILISEITHPAFRDHILTFDHSPSWHSFTGKTSLVEKVKSLVNCGQGLNTDFYAACMRILQRMVYHKIPVGEEPEDLIVLTDMGFDAASTVQNDRYSHLRSKQSNDPWEMQIQRIRNEFVKEGERFWGKGNGWKAPRIVIWNLRAAYNDFHATADQEGVVQLSGWSPSMLKVLQTQGINVQTPYEGLRAALDDARYDPVRALYDTVRA